MTPNPYSYDRDTYLMEDSFHVAKLAAGGCLVLADAILTGEIDRGFALVRPPGHHAEHGRGMGFCILNNIALTARYLLEKYSLERILIIDFDVHHGNGTQEIFYEDQRVLTLSIHQDSLFPFNTGRFEEYGKNKGLGYNINIPVHPQFGDPEYHYIFGKVVQNLTEQYMPQIILVSAGFDGHADDSKSKTLITTAGFKKICETLKYFANQYCSDGLLYILEGGYDLTALEESVLVSLESLVEKSVMTPGFSFSQRAHKLIASGLVDVIKDKWTIL